MKKKRPGSEAEAQDSKQGCRGVARLRYRRGNECRIDWRLVRGGGEVMSADLGSGRGRCRRAGGKAGKLGAASRRGMITGSGLRHVGDLGAESKAGDGWRAQAGARAWAQGLESRAVQAGRGRRARGLGMVGRGGQKKGRRARESSPSFFNWG
ncbi:hypothetical protein SLEP1_g54729 [Rubroshorea leprosula]|uniref:Uncharacterized protein n=1 Tax=Rubroshorea leprosula TaxID=152421 RepID=A0AAV5MDC3_9ROSI|nr:hypothetical protein SLEP1_g54729 [Rubroshorea leprosula]